MKNIRIAGIRAVAAIMLLAIGVSLKTPATAAVSKPDHSHTTTIFAGKAVNGGTVTHAMEGGKHMLTWSDEFQVPGSPAPHWQIVDSKGNVFLLQRLKIKEDKLNRTIVLPSYIKDVAKVQIWCAWAEVLLGEASFADPIKTN
jgi:hypothetical protein